MPALNFLTNQPIEDSGASKPVTAFFNVPKPSNASNTTITLKLAFPGPGRVCYSMVGHNVYDQYDFS